MKEIPGCVDEDKNGDDDDDDDDGCGSICNKYNNYLCVIGNVLVFVVCMKICAQHFSYRH